MKTYRRIKAARIAMEIIQYLADQREPVTGRQVADALGLKYDTAMCYLATLEDEQFAGSAGEHFELGGKMAHIWSRYRARLVYQSDAIASELESLEIEK